MDSYDYVQTDPSPLVLILKRDQDYVTVLAVFPYYMILSNVYKFYLLFKSSVSILFLRKAISSKLLMANESLAYSSLVVSISNGILYSYYL